MRYAASGKLENIRLVEKSHLAVHHDEVERCDRHLKHGP